jgi:hypothetical protein
MRSFTDEAGGDVLFVRPIPMSISAKRGRFEIKFILCRNLVLNNPNSLNFMMISGKTSGDSI